MLGARGGPWPTAGPPRLLALVQCACARLAGMLTAGGKELSQHIVTNSWRSGLLCSRCGHSGGKLPWKEAD